MWTTDSSPQYSSYILEISPYWKSSLDGNPSAILVSATHENAQGNSVFEYNCLWARFNKGDKFCGRVLDDTDILMYPDTNVDNLDYINTPINKDDKIQIKVSRAYDGVIHFKLTPVMSYGQLDNLAKIISIDQSKVASGEILLSKWNYTITQSVGNIIRDESVSTNTEEEIITESIVTTTEVEGGTKTTETKKVITKASKKDVDPTVTTTYIYNLSLTYGFDSYMFEDQVIDQTNHVIEFYDLENLNPTQFTVGQALKNIEDISNSSAYQPVFVETIPENVVRGGNVTLNYILGSSECKLDPNKVYLAIIKIFSLIQPASVDKQSQQSTISVQYYDYRYLYTSDIFNDAVTLTEDFNELYLPILPKLSLDFGSNNISESINGSTDYSDILKDISWVSADDGEIDSTFTYSLNIKKQPDSLTLTYNDNIFSIDVTEDLTKQPTQLEIDEAEIRYNEYALGVLKSSTTSDNTESGDTELTRTYTIKADRKTLIDEVQIGAIRTNLLNLNNNVNQYNLFISETSKFCNSVFLEDESIFTVGMHNDGDDSSEGWSGEVGTVSEKYTNQVTSYDDSRSNEGNEIDLQRNDDNAEYHYSLKHGKYLVQYPSEKEDTTDALSTFLDTDNPHQPLVNSLNSRSVAPVLFVTSGYSGDDADKDHTCNIVYLGPYRAPSSPADGSSDEDDPNNFNVTNPYWFLEWKALNAGGLSYVLGTFFIKYVDKKRKMTYIPTNNYFVIYLESGGVPNVLYLEDFAINKLSRNSINYKALSTSEIATGRKDWLSKQKSVTITPLPNIEYNSTPYTLGDLYATQLAQFGAIKKYGTPITHSATLYTIAEEYRNDLTSLKQDVIDIKRVYKLDLNLDDNKTLLNTVQKNILCNKTNLSSWNDILPSNNLCINVDEVKSTLVYTANYSFNPLRDVLPDFSNNTYLLEVSPFGNTKYTTIPNTIQDNILYYWDRTKESYELYTDTTVAPLYKYSKFKYRIRQEINYDEYSLNKENYDQNNKWPDELDKFMIMIEESRSNLQNVSMPLRYDIVHGLHTNSATNRSENLTFRHIEKAGITLFAQSSHAGPEKKISNLSPRPFFTLKTTTSVDVTVDSNQRL